MFCPLKPPVWIWELYEPFECSDPSNLCQESPVSVGKKLLSSSISQLFLLYVPFLLLHKYEWVAGRDAILGVRIEPRRGRLCARKGHKWVSRVIEDVRLSQREINRSGYPRPQTLTDRGGYAGGINCGRLEIVSNLCWLCPPQSLPAPLTSRDFSQSHKNRLRSNYWLGGKSLWGKSHLNLRRSKKAEKLLEEAEQLKSKTEWSIK